MSDNRYHFITHWRVEGTVEEVVAILDDATDLPRWWPAVYLRSTRLQDGDENHVGEVIDLYTKGLLPYTLRWKFRISEADPGKRIVIRADGDFVGFGIWTFQQDGDWVDIEYEWDIAAEKPLLKSLSVILRPFFAANHRWAMEMGLTSLKLEMARRRAVTPEARALIPPPPPPTTTSLAPYLVAGVVMVGLIAVLFSLLARRNTHRRD
ncbi:MAG: SRPBCC family protein [Anaerolineae bacterium]|nr:SRPBCC family protein [Anaerolineae bacterium]